MARRRTQTVVIGALALVASSLGVAQYAEAAPARASVPAPVPSIATGFVDRTAIGGVSEPVGVAFAPDGTAFVALKTGVIKSVDYDRKRDRFEPIAAATDFANLSTAVFNNDDLGLTGITVDPQFPARPYVYVNYTYNRDPRDNPPVVPKWGQPGEAFDVCPERASIPDMKVGCPSMMRVSRLTAVRSAAGWVMQDEVPLVTAGCFQFGSHGSGDVTFGPDGKLYASAGEGASFRDRDWGQAGNPCGDPVDEGGSLRAQDQRTGGEPADPLGVDGTIFRLSPDASFTPTQATAADWLVAMGQRNPWRLTFRQGREQLWSVDVGSSLWEEINSLPDAPSTSLINRGWPCYEGPGVHAGWASEGKPICTDLYAEGAAAVRPPVLAYQSRGAAVTAGEPCGSERSSPSGIAFSQLGTDWPKRYQDALFFSDFLRGCIWRVEKDAQGQPNPAAVHFFATANAPTDLSTGPGGHLYYVDYGTFVGDSYVAGSGGVHRISYVGAATFKLRASPKKVKIKVNGVKVKAPSRTRFTKGTKLKLKAPRFVRVKGVRYVFVEWVGKGIGRDEHTRRQKLTVRTKPITVKAVYRKKN